MDPVTGAAIVEGGRALANMFGAKNAAGASKDAAQIQSDAALQAAGMLRDSQREALGFQRDVFNQTRADQQPWIQAGQGGVSKLAHLMGISGVGGAGGFTPLSAPAGSGGGSSPTGGLNHGSSGRQFLGTTAEAPGWLSAPRAREFGQPAGAYRWPGQMAAPEDGKPQTPNNIRTRPGFRPARVPGTFASNGGAVTVTMQAPDGTTQQVPRDQVEHFASLGAVIVPGGES